jgi:UTP--glucose-1-phosphate uridylyltransferase
MALMQPAVTKAIIPAAGMGTRFLPATKASPKEMIPLVDKPVIQYVVEEAVASGIREIILVTGRGKRAIEDHFDTTFELEASLAENGKAELLKTIREISEMADFCYVRQAQALGLGHAILCARNLIGDEPVGVFLGDDIIDAPVPAMAQMIQVYEKLKAPIIAIQEVPRSETGQYGILDATEEEPGLFRVHDLVEKPSPEEAPSTLAIVGRYLLTPDVFPILSETKPGKNNEIQLTDALRTLAKRRPVYGFKFQGKRHDTGDKLGFLKATIEFGLKDPELGPPLLEYIRGLKY